MSGGMDRGAGVPLSQRVANTRAAEAREAAERAAAQAEDELGDRAGRKSPPTQSRPAQSPPPQPPPGPYRAPGSPQSMSAPDANRIPTVVVVLIDGAKPGLIARWRHTPQGWEGLVAQAGGVDDFYAEWLPATRLRPANVT
ncbi:hypothetical protein [Propionibacterium freudenreichii]|uniref:hypothetical protein n=1 Tax=Propionibacterium freudenreichii TaxID=1744 RepID=UPI0012FE1987|nr:hypothetical protein [Propionibacterium freudenreichii]MDK9302118.1 hypothetical protein [Propionibacterium freudenreichii]MDK9649324.1 hypothetical protein [Propionibacterium freudenreichii]